MSERGNCTNCGARVGPRDAFCASCRTNLASAAAGSSGPEPTPPRGSTGPSGAGALLGTIGRARRLFADVPVDAKALAALAAVLLLLVFSRFVALAATVVLGASALVLLVRAVRGEPFGRWGLVAAASLAVALASAGVSDALRDGRDGGESGAGGFGPGSETGAIGGAGSFDAAPDMRLCLEDGGPEGYSGPALDFRIVDSDASEAPSGARVLTLVVATGVDEDLNAVAENLAVNPDGYDAAQVTIYPREWAFYDPAQGVVPVPGAPEFVYHTYWVAHSPVGEDFIGLPDENLNECGTSYEGGGYKWGARQTG